MSRGRISDDVQKLAKEFLGREITDRELRLYPYIDYILKNWQKWSEPNINLEEHQIIVKLIMEGHVKVKEEKIYVSKDFYDFISQVLWLSYVSLKTDFQEKVSIQVGNVKKLLNVVVDNDLYYKTKGNSEARLLNSNVLNDYSDNLLHLTDYDEDIIEIANSKGVVLVSL